MITQDDYEKLEGKEVFISLRNYRRYGRVIGCDYYIGVSIQYIDTSVYCTDSDDGYAMCLNGPSSPIKGLHNLSIEQYTAYFLKVISMIKKGSIHVRALWTYYDTLRGTDYASEHISTDYTLTSEHCAFN